MHTNGREGKEGFTPETQSETNRGGSKRVWVLCAVRVNYSRFLASVRVNLRSSAVAVFVPRHARPFSIVIRLRIALRAM
jgi:hypothetical protein